MEDKVILCHHTYAIDMNSVIFGQLHVFRSEKSKPLSLPTVWSVVRGNTLDVGLSAEKKG